MIATHFGWTSDPFDREIPVASLVAFQAHTEVTARLLYAAEHRQVALVTGDTGMGKTTAVRAAMHRLDAARYRSLYVASAGLTSQTLVRILLERMHIEPRFRYTENHALVQKAFEDSYASGQQVVVVIDEGRFLLNFRTAEQQLNERNEALIQLSAPAQCSVPLRLNLCQNSRHDKKELSDSFSDETNLNLRLGAAARPESSGTGSTNRASTTTDRYITNPTPSTCQSRFRCGL